MKVGVVTVTYGNRVQYLDRVLSRLLELGVYRSCVVVNGTPKHIFNHLLGSSKIHFIFNDDNLGSAKAFKRGMNYFKENKEIDYIWLLDDDNLPEKIALQNLKNYITNYSYSPHKDALLSFRPDRLHFKKAVINNNGSEMLKNENSSLGFSMFSRRQQFKEYDRYGLTVAPYGGLFFHLGILENIGYPDESFYLYADDYDFTIRISKNGGKIYLVEDSVVRDLEQSFHLKKKFFFQTRYHKTESFDAIYYSVRNNITFEMKYQVTSLFLYTLNLVIYALLIIISLIITGSFRKVTPFYNAVLDGYKRGNSLYKASINKNK